MNWAPYCIIDVVASTPYKNAVYSYYSSDSGDNYHKTHTRPHTQKSNSILLVLAIRSSAASAGRYTVQYQTINKGEPKFQQYQYGGLSNQQKFVVTNV